MSKRNVFLRVKLKSLAEEARIIHLEEHKANGFKQYKLQNELSEHRKGIVRRQARATLLAYQYLRDIPYHVCEKPFQGQDNNPPDWDAVERMVRRYGGKKFIKSDWVEAQLV